MSANLGAVGQDLRQAMRVLRNNVGYSTVAIVTLALGIGANTAIFSVVNRALLKALPYPNPQRLVILDEYRLQHGSRTVSWLDFCDWREQNQVFDAMAAYRLSYLSLTRTEEPALLRVAEVSSTFFEILGAQAVNGRTFVEQEDMPGAPPVVVVSHGLWKNRMGGDTNVAGKALTLDGVSYTVIGVLPQEFSFFDEPVDAYLPVGLHGADVEWNQRGIHPNLQALARLRARESIDSA
jgi:putative ABC transport system permease protein